MASIPFEYREEACYRFITSGFKQQETVDWMLKTFKDEPTITRSKYPADLCAKTITTGGSGDQKVLNIQAFRNALDRYMAELDAQRAEAHRVEIERLRKELDSEKEKVSEEKTKHEATQRELNQKNTQIQSHLATINRLDRENTIYALKAGDDVENREPAAVS